MVIHNIGSQPPEDDSASAVRQAQMRCGMIADMAGKLLIARYPATEVGQDMSLLVEDAFELAELFIEKMIDVGRQAYDQAKTSEPG